MYSVWFKAHEGEEMKIPKYIANKAKRIITRQHGGKLTNQMPKGWQKFPYKIQESYLKTRRNGGEDQIRNNPEVYQRSKNAITKEKK